MNITFSSNDICKTFGLVASIVPSSSLKHILQGVKVEIKNGAVELVATDLEVLVKCVPSPKACTGEGGIVLPAGRVNNILREWANCGEVLLNGDGSSCVLKSKIGYFKLQGEDYKQFPVINVSDIKEFVKVDGEIISGMIGKVVHAVSTMKARSTLCGVFVKIDKEELVMVAADGNRLSIVKRKVDVCEAPTSGIVTVKCLTYLQRFVSECKGVLKVGIGESQIQFVGERGEVLSQLIDGHYPKYEDVIPKGNDKKISANKDELLSAVRMASFMTSEGYRVVKFLLTKGRLTLSAKTADVGEAELGIDVEYDGPDFEISFNPDYVQDALKVSDNDTVLMEFGDSNSATIFRTGHEQLDVIMPVDIK